MAKRLMDAWPSTRERLLQRAGLVDGVFVWVLDGFFEEVVVLFGGFDGFLGDVLGCV